MAPGELVVVGGVDCHSEFHHAVAFEERGRWVGERRFAATGAGYGRAVRWFRRVGHVAEVGAESSGSYGARLARALAEGAQECSTSSSRPESW